MKKIIILVILLIVFGILVTGCDSGNGIKEPKSTADKDTPEGFQPIIRFVVASDVHIDDSGADNERSRLAQLFTESYRISSNREYNKLDAVIFAGDITNTGTTTSFNIFKDIVDYNIKKETKLLISLGNHEFITGPDKTIKRFTDVFGQQADTHTVINGYHFIGISPDKDRFDNIKKQWLDNEIKKAVEEDNTKPIFVFQHQHVSKTVYGSEKLWGLPDLREVLSKYPQVIDFSGHSHFPINDPRSMWQGDFTALGTGTLSYFELELEGQYEQFPEGNRNAAQFYLIEADAKGRVYIRGYDLISKSFIGESYFIENPSDKGSFKYTTEKRTQESNQPTFEKDAKIEFDDKSGYYITFPAAKDEQIVHHYKINVSNSSGNTVYTKSILSDYYYNPSPANYKVKLQGLFSGGTFNVSVIAVNAFGKQSNPLTLEFKTKGVYIDPNVTVPDADIFESDIKDGILTDISAKKHEVTISGNPKIEFDKEINRDVTVFNGDNSCYKVNGFGSSYDVLQKAFTIEGYFSVDEIPATDYANNIANMEFGGFGFEIYPNNECTFTMYVDGQYVFVRSTIEEGIYYHFAATYDGTTLSLYQNGELADELEVGPGFEFTNVDTAKFLCIGADSHTSGNGQTGITGKIESVKVYSIALNQSQVSKLYNSYIN